MRTLTYVVLLIAGLAIQSPKGVRGLETSSVDREIRGMSTILLVAQGQEDDNARSGCGRITFLQDIRVTDANVPIDGGAVVTNSTSLLARAITQNRVIGVARRACRSTVARGGSDVIGVAVDLSQGDIEGVAPADRIIRGMSRRPGRRLAAWRTVSLLL